MLREPREHSWPNLFIVVKCKHDIGPTLAGKRAVRTGLTFDRPAKSKQGCQNATRLGRGQLLTQLGM